MLIEVKMSGFDIIACKAACLMSQKMADLVLASMVDPQRKCFEGV